MTASEKNILKNEIKIILLESDVKKASLFGSIVNGNYTIESDIDILIEFSDKKNKSLLNLVDLKNKLEEKINRKFDLVTYDSINENLKDHILSHNEIIYE